VTWFADLTPYRYLRHDDGRVRLNVGWLERGRPFDVGPTPPGLAERLASLAAHARAAQTRGLHSCDLCADEPAWDDYARQSSAEIRVVAGDTIFAAPTLVHHYVAAHGYRPPDAFVAAALVPLSVDWETALREDICFSCGSAMTRSDEREAHSSDGGELIAVRAFTVRCDRCGENYGRMVPK
jgi:YgiT-type zinc finger domain-containing protein